jgi:hypothetical protein
MPCDEENERGERMDQCRYPDGPNTNAPTPCSGLAMDGGKEYLATKTAWRNERGPPSRTREWLRRRLVKLKWRVLRSLQRGLSLVYSPGGLLLTVTGLSFLSPM